MPQRAQYFRPVQKILFVDRPISFQIVEGDFKEDRSVLITFFCCELFVAF